MGNTTKTTKIIGRGDTPVDQANHQTTEDPTNLDKERSHGTSVIAVERKDIVLLNVHIKKQAAANTTTKSDGSTNKSGSGSEWGSSSESDAYLNHIVAHQYVQHMEGRDTQSWWVLLDNQSTVDVFVTRGYWKISGPWPVTWLFTCTEAQGQPTW